MLRIVSVDDFDDERILFDLTFYFFRVCIVELVNRDQY